MTRDGFAFVTAEGEKDDVYVKAARLMGALDGDTVRVVVTREAPDRASAGHRSSAPRSERCEGYVEQIIARGTKPFVGVLHIVRNQAWVLMQGRNMPYDIVIPFGGGKGQLGEADEEGNYPVNGVFETFDDGSQRLLTARKGMKVSALVDRFGPHDQLPVGHLCDVLGEPGENDTEMHAILAEFNLPYRFEPEVVTAADGISEEITPEQIRGREDFRPVLTFTIDPADAKDFDDALSFRRMDNGNLEVGVHIADVTWYVRPGTKVDEEARSRGTSVYLVDRTVPMLPEKLSNKLCSLRPHEPKLTFSVVFELTPQARVVSSRIVRTVIDSDWRFDYDTAQVLIEQALGVPLSVSPKAAEAAARVPANIVDAVVTLNALAARLRKKRFSAGSINFDRPEMKVLVDEKGKPVDVFQKVTKEANWLIEEFMLLANRTVAESVGKVSGRDGHGKKEAKTFVYRIHDEPDPEKIAALRNFAGNFGHKMGPTGNGKEISASLSALFSEVAGRPEAAPIELLSLRSMAKARYSTDNIGHYSLAFPFYTHFTSPIRRYPDMMVHRLLTRYLKGGDSAPKEACELLCKHCSEREQIATDAERASIKYKLVEYMESRVGQEFEGTISGLTEWGMYVEALPTHIEGMIPLRNIHSDFFDFDPEHYRLVGRRTRTVYYLGDAVRIRVTGWNRNCWITSWFRAGRSVTWKKVSASARPLSTALPGPRNPAVPPGAANTPVQPGARNEGDGHPPDGKPLSFE